MSVLQHGMVGSGGYQIANSLRFRSSASAYLSRTFGTPTNSGKWTYSTWIKRGALTVFTPILQGYSTLANRSMLAFDTTDHLYFGGPTTSLTSSAQYRDPSAWLHIVGILDITQAAADRAQIWVNGSRITLTGTNNPGTAEYINQNNLHYIARSDTGSTNYGDFVQSEIYFIDGQALTPSSFGETNADGVWVPKKYTGTYGTNGFWLPFSDGTSATTLGYDQAGSNDWTPSGISTTAGVTYDWMTDTPTNNYAVLNPIERATTSWDANRVLSDGNLKQVSGTSSSYGASQTIAFPTTGKWYVEVLNVDGTASIFGIRRYSSTAYGCVYIAYNGGFIDTEAGNQQSSVGNATANDVIGIAVNCDTNQVSFYKNGALVGTAQTYANLALGEFTAYANPGGSGSNYTFNFGFGQAPLIASSSYDSASGGWWRYAPPSGFKALCTANLPSVSITNPRKHFDVVTWAGDNSTSRVVSSSLQAQPDFTWVKSRGPTAREHVLQDVIRGFTTSNLLYSNTTGAEGANAGAGAVTAVNSTSLTVSGTGTMDNVNKSGESYVSWLWKANGSGVTNTSGTITSTVSANTTAGFSIVTFSNQPSGTATVGHGLGAVPKMIIWKLRNDGAGDWVVYHSSLGATQKLRLNSTMAASTGVATWNSTAPTSTLIHMGADFAGSYTSVMYCFAEVPSFSRFGSFVGNSSTDGVYVHLGFRARYILIKCSSTTGNWAIVDTARDTYNVEKARLFPNLANAEESFDTIDVTANGFKLRTTSADWNGSNTYIYAAFAEYPFGGSNIAPSPAR